MKNSKKVLLALCSLSVILNGCANNDEKSENLQVTNEVKDINAPDAVMGMPPGPPPGGFGAQIETTKVAVTEGDWSFDIVTTTNDNKKTVTSTITYYSGKTDSTVIVPAVLGGAPVTKIAAQAFGHHGEITAVYVPSAVEEVADWAFYDLNTALIISFANPDIKVDDSAFQSSGNAKVYMPATTAQTNVGGKEVNTNNIETLSITVENSEAAIIAGGTYLNVTEFEGNEISTSDILNISKSTGDDEHNFNLSSNNVTFNGENYVAKEQKIEIHSDFSEILSANELNKTFKALTSEDAENINTEIAESSSYSKVKSILNYKEGYYVNGNRVELDENVSAYNVKSGEKIEADSLTNLLPSTGVGSYKYVTYRDNDNDGDIDTLYYSPFSVKYDYNSVKIKSDNENLNDLNARDILNPKYLSFANSVIKSDGEDSAVELDSLDVSSSKDGKSIDAVSNEERSILWATNYGTINVGAVNAESTSMGNWAKMSYESELDAYNVEIVMEWGMNALLYATNGGVITAGDLNGERSTYYANGDGANGVIAGGAGTKAGQVDAPSETAAVYLYNADFTLEGWNNHVADVVYGGYSYLENIDSTTGKVGSYSVGQASALANDFGNGVVDAVDFHTTTYGNRSAGAYVIGGGIINAEDSSFISKMDGGLVSASGGTFKIKNSSSEGQMAFRNRGGINNSSTSTFENVAFMVNKDYGDYTYGEKAELAVEAWKEANNGNAELIHYMISDTNMTIGELCENYEISTENQKILLNTLTEIAGVEYTEATLLRNSILDNTYYNYSAGAYTGTTDYSDVPYLTVGSSFGGFVSSVLEFESAGITMNIDKSTFANNNGDDYNYLIASEAGSEPAINISNSAAEGIIWNEGVVQRAVEGRPGNRNSKLNVTFTGSTFTGSFADGSNGLWNTPTSYTDNAGETTSRNGNYYNAEANWGITAEFNDSSTWLVTYDSYLGSLTIEEGTTIRAKEGYSLEMTVDGKKTAIETGEYRGDIVIKLIKK